MASGIKHADTGEGLEQDEMHSPDLHIITADLDVDTHKIINLVDPTNDQDAATKHALDLLGNRYYPLADVTTIWRQWGTRVSSTPRAATISSISNDVITLTAAEAYRFGEWGLPPEYMNAASVYACIRNTTKNMSAWVKASPGVYQLKVTDAADIATWEPNDIISTFGSGDTLYEELDISPLIPAGTKAVLLKMQADDTGPIAWAIGLQVSKEASSGTWCNTFCQVAGLLITAYPTVPVTAQRTLTVRDRATGIDTLQHQISVAAYIK